MPYIPKNVIYKKRHPKGPRFRIPSYDPLELSTFVIKDGRCKKHPDITEGNQRAFYRNMKEKLPHLSKYTDSEIKGMLVGFNKALAKTIIDTRDGVVLPEHMGNMFIGTYGKNTEATDHGNSEKLGKVVHHQNRHSVGYMGWIYYVHNLEKYNFINCNMWWYDPEKVIKKAISEVYKTEWKRYIILPSTKHIEKFIRSYWIKERIRNKQMDERNEYNEFEGLID